MINDWTPGQTVTLTPKIRHADSRYTTWAVAHDGRILGDSRGFSSEADALAEIERMIAKDERDAVRYERPILYVRGC